MTGICVCASAIWRAASKPFITGIVTSMMMMSGRN